MQIEGYVPPPDAARAAGGQALGDAGLFPHDGDSADSRAVLYSSDTDKITAGGADRSEDGGSLLAEGRRGRQAHSARRKVAMADDCRRGGSGEAVRTGY